MELRELADLRADAAGLARDLAAQRFRRLAGLPPAATLPELIQAHRLASSRDGLSQAREALGNAESLARKARLSALVEFLVRARAMAEEPGALQELSDGEERPSVQPPGDAGLHGKIPMVQVERELPFEQDRNKRAELEAALAEAVQRQSGSRSAAWDAAASALSELGLGDPAQAACALQARGWAEKDSLDAACQRLLDGTAAIAEDLGGWLLERHTGSRRFPRGAERHDAEKLIWFPRFASAFPRGELLRTCRRWAEMLRLELSPLELDDDDRPLKARGAHAVPTDPPYQARVTLFPAEGPRALAELLGALGAGLLAVGPPEDAPPEDLWFGDAAVPAACAALFAGLVSDPLWLRRCAKVDIGRDEERAIAYAQVLDARTEAAAALASLEALRGGGLGARTETLHRDLFARATGAELPRGLALRSLDPWLGSWAALRGRALAARLALRLRERHDEDWWRNPRAAAVLSALFARGGRPTLRELWAELGDDEPSIEALVATLSEACK